jgi:hypothetical protein
MLNDFVYWGTAKSMTTLNKTIFDDYGKHMTVKYPFSWAPEANLFLHGLAQGLQPLMVLSCIILARNAS